MTITKTGENKIILTLLLSLVLLWSGFYFSYPNLDKPLASNAKDELPTAADFFSQLKLEAQSAVIYDPETEEVIYGRGEQDIRPLASITKVMTILAANDILEPDSEIIINNDSAGLKKGERWQMKNLAALTLVSSSNEGASAIAQTANQKNDLIVLMNSKAGDLNLGAMKFNNPTGLDDDNDIGGRGSALSVAKLFTYVFKNKPGILAPTKEAVIEEKSLDNIRHVVINTNEIVNKIPGIIASKTGYTELAGGNLAVIANIGLRHPLVFVVLGSSINGRFSDIDKMVQTALDYYSLINRQV